MTLGSGVRARLNQAASQKSRTRSSIRYEKHTNAIGNTPCFHDNAATQHTFQIGSVEKRAAQWPPALLSRRPL
jgi:hypothetical protein